MKAGASEVCASQVMRKMLEKPDHAAVELERLEKARQRSSLPASAPAASLDCPPPQAPPPIAHVSCC